MGILRKGSDQLAGYSFITYADVDTAQRVTAMGTLQFEGQELKLSTAVRKVRVVGCSPDRPGWKHRAPREQFFSSSVLVVLHFVCAIALILNFTSFISAFSFFLFPISP